MGKANLLLNWICVAVIAPVIGGFLLHLVYALLADIPAKDSLRWLTSNDSYETTTATARKGKVGMRFSAPDYHSLTVREDREGYRQLLTATQSGGNFRIGYNPERMYLSDSPKLYNILYEIQVEGVKHLSYEAKVRKLKWVCLALALLGLMLVGIGLRYLVVGPAEGMLRLGKVLNLNNRDVPADS